MLFRTELHPTPAAFKLNLTSKVVTVGSCFSDVIGQQLEKYKIETLTNPFGTIFNPLSACKLLQICTGADVELAEAFVQNNGRWYSYDFHSSFSAETEEELYEMLDEVIVKTRRFLKKADVLILTLGTANIFRLNITGETVANCHKIPAANFTRETLLPEEIITAVAETHSLLRELNPNLKLVLTVSPVRHIKDSLELNSVSKSVLRLATHFLTQSLPDNSYFPAYELLIDDLRDYRFYKEDLLHPTPLAEKYIWEKFTGSYFESGFQSFMAEWDTILRAKEHKPFYPESAAHQAFIQQMLEKLRVLQEKVNVSDELAWFENQVIAVPEPVEEETETEDEVVENEVIPGYFSEETESTETELATAALTETPELAIAEENAQRKKKKKKPRKKKRKPGIALETGSLSEVGTAAVPAETTVHDIPAETITDMMEVIMEPEHEVEHYGETLSSAAVEQIKPGKSKSAKRRESRRRKKAMEASANVVAPEISEEPETLLQPAETAFSAMESIPSAENATVPAEKSANIPAEIPAKRTKQTKPEKVTSKAKGRKKKPAFAELFAPETEPSKSSETVPVEDHTSAENQPETNAGNAIEKSETAALPARTKGRGRKPKAGKLPATEAEPVTETIAVPFVPTAKLEEPELVIPEAGPIKKRGRKPKSQTKETGNETTDNSSNTQAEQLEKPARKPVSRKKKTTLET